MSIRQEVQLLKCDDVEHLDKGGHWFPAINLQDPRLDWETQQWLSAPIFDVIEMSIRLCDKMPYSMWNIMSRRSREYLESPEKVGFLCGWTVFNRSKDSDGDLTSYVASGPWKQYLATVYKAYEMRFKVKEVDGDFNLSLDN